MILWIKKDDGNDEDGEDGEDDGSTDDGYRMAIIVAIPGHDLVLTIEVLRNSAKKPKNKKLFNRLHRRN